MGIRYASRMLVCILDDFLCIPIDFLGFSGYLFAETFDLLLFVADQFSSFFLYFTSDVFYNPFDLIFVHYHIPSSKLTGSPCENSRLNVLLPPFCTITVSYTHLRAHETDSYLVCRLLLEKKKK